MEKNLRYSALLSVYGALLTDKQLDTMEYYYDEDLSLGEIAENTGISRQGVRDFIKRAEELLDEYEEKLRLCEKMQHVAQIEEKAREIERINRTCFKNKAMGELSAQIIDLSHKLR